MSSYQDFPKIKKGSGSNLPALFYALFLEKSFSLIIYHYLKHFILLLSLLGNRFSVIVSQPCCEIVDFEIDLIFLFKTFFLHDQKSRQKFEYLDNEKNFLDEIKNVFNCFKKLLLQQMFLKVKILL